MNFGPPTLLANCLYLAAVVQTAVGAPEGSALKLPPRDAVLIAEAYHLWAAVAEGIWPGTSGLQAPFVYVGERQEFAIGFPRALAGFSDTGEKLGGKSIQVRNRTLAPDLSASFPLDGVPAALMGSPEALKKNLASWVITAGHEMFHVFQAAHGSYEKVAGLQIGPKDDASWQLTFPFPYADAEAMRLIHLQGFLVWLASGTASPEDAKYSIGTAVDAVQVYRSYLKQRTGDEKAYRYSQFQEWNEGVAAYFEYKLAERAAAAGYHPTSDYLALPGVPRYDVLWREAYESRPFLTKHAGRATKSRNAFYHLGAGKALALDRVDAAWKKRYFQPDLWLDDLLISAAEAR